MSDTATQTGPTGPGIAKVEDVEEAMRDVVDPELGINVVDLGLVYGVHVDDDNACTLDMTLTSAACPLTDVIEDQTNSALSGLVKDDPDQLGLDAAVGPGQDHRRRPRAAARPRLQRLTQVPQVPVLADEDRRTHFVLEHVERVDDGRTRKGRSSPGSRGRSRRSRRATRRR